MIKKIIIAIILIAVGVLGTMAFIYREDVKGWFEKTFKQTEVTQTNSGDTETDEGETLSTSVPTITPGPLTIVVEG